MEGVVEGGKMEGWRVWAGEDIWVAILVSAGEDIWVAVLVWAGGSFSI